MKFRIFIKSIFIFLLFLKTTIVIGQENEIEEDFIANQI